MSFTVVRDSTWRDSTFHLIFCCGSAYVDIKCDKDGKDATTGNMSFDGEGCLRDCTLSMPQELAGALIAKVPCQKDQHNVEAGTDLAEKVRSWAVENVDSVPADWREAFEENLISDGSDSDE